MTPKNWPKGPWRIGPLPNVIEFAEPTDDGAEAIWITECTTGENPAPEVMRLLTAAPSLYGALRDARWLLNVLGSRADPVIAGALDDVDAALALADGKDTP